MFAHLEGTATIGDRPEKRSRVPNRRQGVEAHARQHRVVERVPQRGLVLAVGDLRASAGFIRRARRRRQDGLAGGAAATTRPVFPAASRRRRGPSFRRCRGDDAARLSLATTRPVFPAASRRRHGPSFEKRGARRSDCCLCSRRASSRGTRSTDRFAGTCDQTTSARTIVESPAHKTDVVSPTISTPPRTPSRRR